MFKTIIKRGKNPLAVESMQPLSIYSVRRVLSEEESEVWHTKVYEQWGLLLTDEEGKVYRSWNVVAHNVWRRGEIDLSSVKVFYASALELRLFGEMNSVMHLQSELSKFKSMLAIERDEKEELRQEVKFYYNHWLHRFVDMVIGRTDWF